LLLRAADLLGDSGKVILNGNHSCQSMLPDPLLPDPCSTPDFLDRRTNKSSSLNNGSVSARPIRLRRDPHDAIRENHEEPPPNGDLPG
jgi:hypothetical protein